MIGPARHVRVQTPDDPNPSNAQTPESDISPLTFYEYLQRDRKKDLSYRCRVLGRSQTFGGGLPVVQGPVHECVDFRKVELLDMAQRYVEAEWEKPLRHYSVYLAQLLHWLLLLTIFMPLNLVVLFVWLPIVTLNSMRKDPLPQIKFPPYHWALRISLWAVFVPYAKIASHGGLQEMLFLWSLQPPYLHAKQDHLELGKALVQERKNRLEHLKSIQQALAQDEHRALQDLKDALPNNEEEDEAFSSGLRRVRELRRVRTEAWRRSVGDSQFVKDQIAAIIAEIHEICEAAGTQTNKELTGYAGVSDWGKEALEARSGFFNAMSVICVLGAGLSYSSIMSQRSNHPFATPLFWDFVIDILQYGALATVAAAIVLLVVSVQLLTVPHSSASDAIQTFSPKPAAYATYALFGTILVIVIVAIYVFWSANGFEFFLAQRFVHRHHVRTKGLEDFVSYPDFYEV
ncbi:uncharacterized protein EI90DRAFT_3128814 [Cantharellus anzutake]|uniref:uncharacterized protein n=1 Tax=Cantharellus anzutake TaxID=1750568 RepID=UPI001909057A|nr:uncharacterized protein EI90DRAFT_3128814 [Cantharellus anzutake]KAF8325447.1 hypothetical protein EI90DRAFT_3128814 [Cantharellus anzutake]